MSDDSSEKSSIKEFVASGGVKVKVKKHSDLLEYDYETETEDMPSCEHSNDTVKFQSITLKSESECSSDRTFDKEYSTEASDSSNGKEKIQESLESKKMKKSQLVNFAKCFEATCTTEGSMVFLGQQDESEENEIKKMRSQRKHDKKKTTGQQDESEENEIKKMRSQRKHDKKKTNRIKNPIKVAVNKNKKQKNYKKEIGKKCDRNMSHRCSYCDKLCRSRGRLEIHWKQKHKNEKPFTCDRCQNDFQTKGELRKHCWTIHPRPDGWYLCQFCEKSFNKKSNLVTHERTHTGEKPFVCDQCGKGFSLNSSLKRHADVHVTEEERGGYKCEICLKDFATAMRRKRHYITHKTERDHPCEVCGKAFTQTSSLTVHMKTHFAERSYHCPYCTSAFTRGQHLKKHLKHAKNTAGLRIRCRLCDANFPCSGALTIHMNTHEQYVKKKIFACDVCDKKFARKVELRRHNITHIEYDDLPFQCQVCSKRFGRNDTYSNHMKNVHPVENAVQKALKESKSNEKTSRKKQDKKQNTQQSMTSETDTTRNSNKSENPERTKLKNVKPGTMFCVDNIVHTPSDNAVTLSKTDPVSYVPVFPTRFNDINISTDTSLTTVSPLLSKSQEIIYSQDTLHQRINDEVFWKRELYQNLANIRTEFSPYSYRNEESGLSSINPSSFGIVAQGTVPLLSDNSHNNSSVSLLSINSNNSDDINIRNTSNNDIRTEYLEQESSPVSKYYL